MWETIADPLSGRIVALEALGPEHAEGLQAAAVDPRIWEITNEVIAGPDDFARWLDRALDEAGRGVAVPFATLEAPTRRPIASTRYGTLRPEHR